MGKINDFCNASFKLKDKRTQKFNCMAHDSLKSNPYAMAPTVDDAPMFVSNKLVNASTRVKKYQKIQGPFGSLVLKN